MPKDTATLLPALEKKKKKWSQERLSEGLAELLGQDRTGMSLNECRKQRWSEVGLLFVWI